MGVGQRGFNLVVLMLKIPVFRNYFSRSWFYYQASSYLFTCLSNHIFHKVFMQRCKAHIWNSNSWVHKLLEESSIRRKVSIFILFTISTNFFPHPSKMCVLYFDWCARNTDWFCPLFWQGLKITLIKNFPRDFYYIMILKFPFHFTGSQLNVR